MHCTDNLWKIKYDKIGRIKFSQYKVGLPNYILKPSKLKILPDDTI